MPVRTKLINYSTDVDHHKTVGEIQQMLAASRHVSELSIVYAPAGAVTAIRFMTTLHEQPVWFRVEAYVEGVLAAMKKQGVSQRYQNIDQARRVAWRLLKTWVEVQLALVAVGQAQMSEVFLPYAVDTNGQRFFEAFEDTKRKLLTS